VEYASIRGIVWNSAGDMDDGGRQNQQPRGSEPIPDIGDCPKMLTLNRIGHGSNMVAVSDEGRHRRRVGVALGNHWCSRFLRQQAI
jgi:hypothetical protein